jgi:Leucine-rich repeat (LRR) protein
MKKIILLLMIVCLWQTKAKAVTCNVQDSLELVNVYNALGGANWTAGKKWNLSTPVATWYGVYINTSGANIGRVKELFFDNNNAIGVVPNMNLPNLTYLYIYNNSGITTIPSLSTLTNLTTLEIYGCSSTMTTLPSLSTLTNLTQLYIGYNSGISSLPSLSTLTNLTHLHIYGCGSTMATLPSLSTLTNLTHLSIGYNSGISSIPSLSTLTNLKFLYIGGCGSTMTTLPSLSTLTNLTSLFIGYNSGISSIPSLSTLTNLTQLSIGYNSDISSIPSLSTLTNLTNLYIDSNSGISSLPSLSTLTNLTLLDISNNSGITTIPSLSTLTNLTLLVISGCGSTMTTLPSLSTLTNLTNLQIYGNSGITTIPSLSTLTNLTNLDIRSNRLVGNIQNVTFGNTTYNYNVSGNKLTFGSILNAWTSINNANYNTNNNGWSGYAPQDTLLPLSNNSGTLTANLAGANLADLTYTWYKNGTQVAGPFTGNNTYTPTQSGTYTYNVTHALVTQPAVASRNLILNSQGVFFCPPNTYAITATTTDATCTQKGSIALSAGAAGTIASVTYVSPNVASGTVSSANISNAGAGTYSIQATLTNGCVSSPLTGVIVDHSNHKEIVSKIYALQANAAFQNINWNNSLNDPNMIGWTGITTEANMGCVTDIVLSYKNIHGTLAQLQGMDSLKTFRMNYNGLSGALGLNYPNVKLIDFSNNNFSGVNTLVLPKVENIYLTGNNANNSNATAKTTIAAQNLPNLKNFYANNSKITTFGAFVAPELQTLCINDNEIETLPTLNFPKGNNLYIYANKLKNLPSITMFNNSYNNLYVHDNYLDFGDLLGWPYLNNYYAGYAPQKTVVPTGYANNKLAANPGGNQNQTSFKWFLNGVLHTTISSDSTFVPTQSGTWYCEMTHAGITQT